MLAARWVGLSVDVAVMVALCAVAGNGWPVYLRFNGGRGVAVATGAVAAVTIPGLLALLVCYGLSALRGRIALGVIGGFVVLPVVAFLASGVTVALGCAGILALIVMRRMEGLVDDVRVYGHAWERVYRRLIFDERPGRPLMGPRTDPGAEAAHRRPPAAPQGQST